MADLTFLTKEKLDTGFGEQIVAPTSYEDILKQAGLNWTVTTKDTAYIVGEGEDQKSIIIPKVKTVVREDDGKALGIVTDKYKLVNNDKAFDFVENLYSTDAVQFVRGGSFKGGRATWLEGKVAQEYSVFGDKLECYIVFRNNHDGKGSVTALVVPHRVECSNFFNLPLADATRAFRCKHSGDPMKKIKEAQEILLTGSEYMTSLQKEAEALNKIKLTGQQVQTFIERLFPMPDEQHEKVSKKVKDNILVRRVQLMSVFLEKEDLANFDFNGYRFMSAVTDWVDHNDGRNTANGAYNRYMSVISGSPLVDMAYKMVKSI